MEDIKQLFLDELKIQGENDTIIIEIFKTGSQIFKDNPNDLDYVAVCENYSKGYKRVVKKLEKDYDLFIFDKNYILDRLNFKDSKTSYKLKLSNYFFCFRDEKIFGNWNFKWNILNHKQDYLKYMKKLYWEMIGIKKDKKKHTKGFVHYYIPLKIFENNKVEITEEMLEDIRKLYEGGKKVIPIVRWIESKLKDYKTKANNKREELINYILNYSDNENLLVLEEKVISADKSKKYRYIKNGDIGTKTIDATDDQIIEMLKLNFSKKLKGHYPNEASLIEITSWHFKDK